MPSRFSYTDRSRRLFPASAFPALLLSALASLHAFDIEGVQPAALDQPRINVMLRRNPAQQPLAGKPAPDIMDLLEPKTKPKKAYNIQAFLDTGASGIVISSATADSLGIVRITAVNPDNNQSQQVVFHDVGVAGSDQFHVSEPLYFALAPFHPGTDTQDPARDYRLIPDPLRLQIGPVSNTAGIMQLLLGNLDVVGMPALIGKVVVIDPKPVNQFDDTMRTYVYDPRTPFNLNQAKRNPGIPTTNRHVRLSYASFARFTHATPRNAQPPTLTKNPFIGPDPTAHPNAKPDTTPPITLMHAGKLSTASFLLDTGAAASMISTEQAAALGITYAKGTRGTNSPLLDGIPKTKQFILTVGGIGGGNKSAGFFLDELRVPTRQGDPLIYKPAPVLVCDITVQDPATKQQFTLDGIFGMNLLTATAQLGEGLIPEIGKLVEGAFDWIVFDEPNAILGLQLRQ
ncbi:MAG: pepsin/retropepsin-like aspartic protease family protein [Planctomycetota bacterium]|nr:pepsin/retropepsin-like aspartic protease family protein [Planctomycetota bacterium]